MHVLYVRVVFTCAWACEIALFAELSLKLKKLYILSLFYNAIRLYDMKKATCS